MQTCALCKIENEFFKLNFDMKTNFVSRMFHTDFYDPMKKTFLRRVPLASLHSNEYTRKMS